MKGKGEMIVYEVGEYASLDEAQSVVALCKKADKRRGKNCRYYIRMRVICFED